MGWIWGFVCGISFFLFYYFFFFALCSFGNGGGDLTHGPGAFGATFFEETLLGALPHSLPSRVNHGDHERMPARALRHNSGVWDGALDGLDRGVAFLAASVSIKHERHHVAPCHACVARHRRLRLTTFVPHV